MSVPLSARMGRIKASPTAQAMARAAARKADGHPVISLTTGEPDFDTPVHIQDAAIAAIRGGDTRYTAIDGTPALKRAVQAKYLRDNGLDYSLDQIIVSTGAKQVIFNAILASISTGDEVIIPTPSWVSYPDMVSLAGGIPVMLECGPEDGFKPAAARIAAKITPRTRAIMLNAPSNPTGAMFSKTELEELGEVLTGRPDILVITDDIYEHIRYTDGPFLTLAQVCPALKEQVLTVNGVSKSYAMTGWRIGFGAGPAHLINAMKILQSQSTTNPNSIAQAAAAAALDGGMETVEAQRQAFHRRRDRLVGQLQKIDGLDVFVPDGAFYLFVGIKDLLGRHTPAGIPLTTEADWVDHLLVEGNVGVVGGAGFGTSPYFRLSFAASDEDLDRVAERIASLVDALT